MQLARRITLAVFKGGHAQYTSAFQDHQDHSCCHAGRVVYHGPKEDVVPFFESLGFELPPRKGTADFLQEITSKKDQRVGIVNDCTVMSMFRGCVSVGICWRETTGHAEPGVTCCQQQYWAGDKRSYHFISPAEMAEAFWRSPVGQAAAAELAEPPQRTPEGGGRTCMRIRLPPACPPVVHTAP